MFKKLSQQLNVSLSLEISQERKSVSDATYSELTY